MNNPLDELRLMGEKLGKPWWAQGPGGNVSIKTGDGELWVKASGKRLKDVAGEGGFSRVPINTALRASAGDKLADAELFSIIPRPSLETYFHAFPGRVVAHTHSMGALLLACSSRRDKRGAAFESVPYSRPGREIALALREVWENSGEQAFLLRSHGLVVSAAFASRAIYLTAEIDGRIVNSFGKLPPFESLVAQYLESVVTDVRGGKIRHLPSRAENQPVRYLFPDAAVYATRLLIETIDNVNLLAENALRALGRPLVLVDFLGQRVAAAPTMAQLDDTCEVTAAHDWLEDALGSEADYLPDDEPAKIVSMPSEQYRIRLHGQG